MLILGIGILLVALARDNGNIISFKDETFYRLIAQGPNLELVTVEHELDYTYNLRPEQSELAPFFFMPVPINHATAELLKTLPGIGPGMAERIIDYRQSVGIIQNDEDLQNVPGIGKSRMKTLRKLISFEE